MVHKINITGFIFNQKTKKAIANLKVEAWDKDMVVDDLVGSAVTDSNGRFEITFSRKYFSELFLDRKPDLFFKIFKESQLIKSTKESVLWNITGDKDDIEILIDLDKTKPTNSK